MVRTRQGWIGREEVVEVHFDPEVLPAKELQRFAAERKFRHLAEAEAMERLDAEQKYYLLQTPLAALALSEAQACRVNATLEGDWRRWLTPSQREQAEALLKAAAEAEEAAAG